MLELGRRVEIYLEIIIGYHRRRRHRRIRILVRIVWIAWVELLGHCRHRPVHSSIQDWLLAVLLLHNLMVGVIGCHLSKTELALRLLPKLILN